MQNTTTIANILAQAGISADIYTLKLAKNGTTVIANFKGQTDAGYILEEISFLEDTGHWQGNYSIYNHSIHFHF